MEKTARPESPRARGVPIAGAAESGKKDIKISLYVIQGVPGAAQHEVVRC